MAKAPKKVKSGKNPALAAAVLKALLLKNPEAGNSAELELYKGVLRDLSLTDQEVEEYLVENGDAVEEAIRAHGRRGS